ncbi:hypothetical protein THAOC_29848, partial [Thalassiosira oceanica]
GRPAGATAAPQAAQDIGRERAEVAGKPRGPPGLHRPVHGADLVRGHRRRGRREAGEELRQAAADELPEEGGRRGERADRRAVPAAAGLRLPVRARKQQQRRQRRRRAG